MVIFNYRKVANRVRIPIHRVLTQLESRPKCKILNRVADSICNFTVCNLYSKLELREFNSHNLRTNNPVLEPLSAVHF